MKLLHVALAVKAEDVKRFYEDILGFTSGNSFRLQERDTSNIFNLKGQAEIIYMEKDSLQLELFVSTLPQQLSFSHICFEDEDAGEMFGRAKESGYQYFERKKEFSSTYFIKDGNGNLFEMKKNLEN